MRLKETSGYWYCGEVTQIRSLWMRLQEMDPRLLQTATIYTLQLLQRVYTRNERVDDVTNSAT